MIPLRSQHPAGKQTVRETDRQADREYYCSTGDMTSPPTPLHPPRIRVLLRFRNGVD